MRLTLKVLIFIFFAIVGLTYSRADDVLTDKTGVFRNSADFDDTVRRYIEGEQPKIIGGSLAQEGEFPWQVSLVVSWIADPSKGHFCGGSIYNQTWIVTAAHCLENLKANDVNVVYGTNKLAPSAKRANVQSIVINNQHNTPVINDNDIALIQLKETIILDDKSKIINIMPHSEQGTVLTENNTFVVTGWGSTQEGGQPVKDLRKVEVPFVSRNRCADPLSYGSKITDNMLCAGKTGVDSCQGDSGGPLVYPGSSGPYLVGIVSWGEGCARAGKYGVYTNASNYAAWVKDCVNGAAGCVAK